MPNLLTKLPHIPTNWHWAESEIGGAMDTLRLDVVGRIAAKAVFARTDEVAPVLPYEGLGLILSGRGTYRVGDGPVRTVVSPAVFYAWPGPVFHYGPDAGTTWDERYLCFSGPRAEDWLRWKWLTRPDRPRPLAEPHVLERLHDRIGQNLRQGGRHIDEAKLDAERVILLLKHETLSHCTNPMDDLLERWTANPADPIDLHRTAMQMGMSFSHFRQQFLLHTSESPYQFILKLRIDKACRELGDSNLAIKCIALTSGFHSVESFHRAFRVVKGVPPGEYRRRLRFYLA